MHRDSLGNVYSALPKRKDPPKAKGTNASPVGKRGRNAAKCKAYRFRVGKPNGPGKDGNKSGKNKS